MTNDSMVVLFIAEASYQGLCYPSKGALGILSSSLAFWPKTVTIIITLAS